MVNAAQQPNCEVIQADPHDVSGFLGRPCMAGMIGSSRGKLEASYDVNGEKLRSGFSVGAATSKVFGRWLCRK